MDIREQLRGALPAAIKARDAVAVAALRSALAAIENAEAVDSSIPPQGEGERQRAGGRGPQGEGERQRAGGWGSQGEGERQRAGGWGSQVEVEHAHIAGGVAGVGAADVQRRTLTQAQMEAIVRAEVSDRQAAERDYRHAGQRERAEQLRGEADVLLSYLGGT